MTSGTTPDLKSKLFIADGLPATFNQAGYEPLEWLLVKGVVSLPQWGDTAEDIAEATLADGRQTHTPGLLDGGMKEIPVKHVDGDTGMALAYSKRGKPDAVAIKIEDPDGAVYYNHGVVMSCPRRERTTSSNKGWLLNLGVNGDEVYVAPVVA